MTTALPVRLHSSEAFAAVPALFAPRLEAAKRFIEFVDIEPVHIAAYIGLLGKRLAALSVKQHEPQIIFPVDRLMPVSTRPWFSPPTHPLKTLTPRTPRGFARSETN